jgi:hypothetical protein
MSAQHATRKVASPDYLSMDERRAIKALLRP